MPRQWIAAVLVLGVALLGYFAWRSSHVPAQPEAAAPSSGQTGMEMPPADANPPDPGVEWDVPRAWSEGSGSSMRLATYQIPGAGGEAATECAVYYFGPGQGGTTEANIERWLGEFESRSEPERTTRRIRGMAVTRIRVKGNYAAHAAGMGTPQGPRANQQLLGAIVEGPNGPVFFKLVGPARTVDAAASDFERMLESLKTK